MKHFLPALLIASTVWLVSCGKSVNSDPTAAGGSDLAGFVEKYFNAYYTFNPSEGTSAGLHEYDKQLEERNVNRIRARIAELQGEATEIAAIRKMPLKPQDAIDAELLDNRVQAELLDLDSIRVWRSPLHYAGIAGNSVDLLMKRAFETPVVRLERVTSRIRMIPALMDAMRDNTLEPPKEHVDLAIKLLHGSASFFRDSVPVWARSAAGSNNPQALTDFLTVNRKAVAALEVMARHLEDSVSMMGTGSYATGAEKFLQKLKYEEMVDLPLDKLLAIGEQRLAQDHQAFLDVAKQVAPGRSPKDAMAVLEANHPTEAGLMEFARNTLENVKKFVQEKKIVPVPSELLPKVEPTPPYARSGGFASMDTPGAFETTAKEAFYYVTPAEPGWDAAHKTEHLKLFNRPVMDMITIHEAYPGHYLQFLYVKQFPTRTRKLTYCSSNVEGWAHYAEQMMLEEGFGGGDPKMRLAQLSEALVRDARYVAGIKLHTEGWTVDQATALFEEKAFMQHANAYEEARRGTYNPTYLYYTLGKMQIYKLREDYKQAKGAAYSLGKFHEEFVRQGGIPIRLIRRIMLPGDTGSDL
ncbi:MAG: DUF885 domain-containing protein [Bryobacteraceae bacterium]|nr:DUF885 domain-containing protein [Bryobacteraceae bacterium]